MQMIVENQKFGDSFAQLQFNFDWLKDVNDTKKNRRKLTEEELEYICRFYEFDGPAYLADALELPKKAIVQKVYMLRKNGLYEKYKYQRRYWV